MATTSISSSIVIDAPAEAVFAVLVDPARHVAIDGTGWVRQPRDRQLLIGVGQIFRMGMYHPDHPDGEYEMANRVEVFEPPRAVSWMPGYDTGDGTLGFGGWVWRYDLVPLPDSRTWVRLTCDWSAVPEEVVRHHGGFPSFPPEHLDGSLARLAGLVAPGSGTTP